MPRGVGIGILIRVLTSYWRHTSLPISADSTFPGSASDFRRFDSCRSPIRFIGSMLGSLG
eukprot:331237-Pyramimonas_sp.AAC.1